MENLANEIFNILKGANYKLRLFDMEGQKTLDPELATRFYAYDQDLMVTIRTENASYEVVVQAGASYNVPDNDNLIKSLRSVAHKNLGEFTLRKFNKNITPKDFASQSIAESNAFGKSFGSIKTSYIPAPNAKIIIKHSKRVDEEKRGARSRNIHSIFIENAQGERFKFQYSNVSGAKAMARHVSEGGTPYDAKGQAILKMCEDISDIAKFVKHVRSNNLVNEANEDIVATAKQAAKSIKESLKRLSTLKGYNNFEIQEEKEEQKSVDITEKFMYNGLDNGEMDKAVSLVSRIVAEKSEKDRMNNELLKQLGELIKSGADLKIELDPNDPEHPNNEDPVKYSGPQGPMAKLSSMLSLIAARSKNDEASNIFAKLSTDIHDMDSQSVVLVAKVVNYIEKKAGMKQESEVNTTESLSESAMTNLRKKIS